MTRNHVTVALALALAALAADGCSSPEIIGEQQPGPAIVTRWAISARDVMSKATPHEAGEDGEEVRAEWGPSDDRDDGELTSVDEEEPGDVVVDLGPGVWVLDERVRLQGGTLTIKGAGPAKTRLELATETSGALVCVRPTKVRFEGLTIVATESGGIGIKGCPDVRADDVHFVAMRYGMDLDGSTARITSCVFAGCERGLQLKDATAIVRETAFMECWDGIVGSGRVDVESCAFVEGRDAIDVQLARDSSIVSCLVVGDHLQPGWKGTPKHHRSNLLPASSIPNDEKDRHRPIAGIEEFPDGLRQGLPPAFDVVAVHLALLRSGARGGDDPVKALQEARATHAESHARAAQSELKRGAMDAARDEALLALRYWGNAPLADAPEAVGQVADLARP